MRLTRFVSQVYQRLKSKIKKLTVDSALLTLPLHKVKPGDLLVLPENAKLSPADRLWVDSNPDRVVFVPSNISVIHC